MDTGWVRLYRKSINNPLYKKPLVWHYWQYCLLKANHQDKKIIWNKKEMIIQRGSFITGRKKAAKETGLSQQNIRTATEVLVNLGMIEKSTTKSTTKFTYITVCKYNEYQNKKQEANQQTNQQLTSNQPSTNHKQEGKELKRIKNKNLVSFNSAETQPDPSPSPKPSHKDIILQNENFGGQNDKNEKVYVTQKKRKLKSHQLECFEKFWNVFDGKQGKRSAADAWIDLKVTEKLLPFIIAGAQKYCKERVRILQNNGTPKMAQGWLSSRRWEDEITEAKTSKAVSARETIFNVEL